MKILQSCLSRSWGGLEIFALNTTLQLKARGHELCLLCCENSKLFEQAVKKNIHTIAVPFSKIPRFSSVLKASKIFQSEKFNIVHTHLSHDLWILVPALRLARSDAKLFLTRHMGSRVNKKDFLHQRLYNRVTRVFAISNYVKQSVLDTCPVNEDRVTVLHPALELDNYSASKFNKEEIRKSLGIQSGKVVIGMASRFSPGKGHEEFLKAAKILSEEPDNNVFFIAAGDASFGEEKYREMILNLSAQLGLKYIVKFTGHSDNIAEILSAMDIFVMPSHEESFGILLTEAMAMERPAVASNNAGIPDIAIDNETALLVPPKNHEALASALKRLTLSSELRYRLGKDGRKRAEGIFNVNSALDKLEYFYAG